MTIRRVDAEQRDGESAVTRVAGLELAARLSVDAWAFLQRGPAATLEVSERVLRRQRIVFLPRG